MSSSAIVQKLWNYCNILRDDGLSYGDYVEQLTFLLFLKMADEQSRAPFNKRSPIPAGFDWASLLAKDGDELEIHYRHRLETLGKEKGMLGVIFRKAQNKIQDPPKLTNRASTFNQANQFLAEANARQERAGDGTKAPSTSRTSIFAILSATLLCTSAICGESRNAFSFRSRSS